MSKSGDRSGQFEIPHSGLRKSECSEQGGCLSKPAKDNQKSSDLHSLSTSGSKGARSQSTSTHNRLRWARQYVLPEYVWLILPSIGVQDSEGFLRTIGTTWESMCDCLIVDLHYLPMIHLPEINCGQWVYY